MINLFYPFIGQKRSRHYFSTHVFAPMTRYYDASIANGISIVNKASASARTIPLDSCRSTHRLTTRFRQTSIRDTLPPVPHPEVGRPALAERVDNGQGEHGVPVLRISAPPLLNVINRKILVTSVRNLGLPHPASTIIWYSFSSRLQSNSPTKAPVSRCFSMSDFLSIFRTSNSSSINCVSTMHRHANDRVRPRLS